MLSERGTLAPGVSSAKSLTVAPRRPADVGLYRRMPMRRVQGSGFGARGPNACGLARPIQYAQLTKRNQSCVRDPTSQSLFSTPVFAPFETGCGAACLCGFECEHAGLSH